VCCFKNIKEKSTWKKRKKGESPAGGKKTLPLVGGHPLYEKRSIPLQERGKPGWDEKKTMPPPKLFKKKKNREPEPKEGKCKRDGFKRLWLRQRFPAKGTPGKQRKDGGIGKEKDLPPRKKLNHGRVCVEPAEGGGGKKSWRNPKRSTRPGDTFLGRNVSHWKKNNKSSTNF